MQSIRPVLRGLLSFQSQATKFTPVAGLKDFPVPVVHSNIEYPERQRLKIVDKVPQYPPSMRPMKMQKRLKLMRGPEEIHNTLLHKQYGIIATRGGRMRHGHFEMIRMTLVRNIDYEKIFVIWRVDAPWQPVTKKGQGQRMGGGKGSIDHYVTPLKAGRVIIEVGGEIEFFEVQRILKNIANKLPFKAMAVSQTLLEEMAAEEKKLENENQNPWTWKYMIQNNMLGCHRWISPMDKYWFNKYL